MDIAIQVERTDGWDRVNYVGPINEDSEVHLAPLMQQMGERVVFNFRKVEYVNSCGVRAWINFLREAENGRKIVFEECTPEIVSQINMIPNFKGSAHIKSVYASFVCNACDHQMWHIFEEGKNLPASPDTEVQAPKCEKCESDDTEMEELEDEFFSWLEAS